MSIKRVAPAPTDEQLAAAEQTEIVRRRDREAAIEDEQEQERLALAGEPESEARVALRASASVLNSRPVGIQEPEDERTPSTTEAPPTPRRNRRAVRSPAKTDGRVDSELNRSSDRALPKSTPAQEEEPDSDKAEAKAYQLMDLAFRKWEKNARKDLRKANRDLALDLGKDTVLYLQRGIIRLNDWGDYINKLTATKTGEREQDADGEDFDTELETMRAALRDGR